MRWESGDAGEKPEQGWLWQEAFEQGHIWQKRFYDFVVRSEGKKIEKLRYIHHNPVARRLVLEPGRWKWSSYRWYAYGERGPALDQRTASCGDEDARAAQLHGVEGTGTHLLKSAKGGTAIVRVSARKSKKQRVSQPPERNQKVGKLPDVKRFLETKEIMLINKLSWIVAVGTLSGVLFTQGQTAQPDTDQFVVGPGEVLAPKGVFLLVRKGGEIGAIRFTSIEHGKEVGTGKASYESYFQKDGSGSFQSPNVQMQMGNIDLKPLKGIGRTSFQFGKDKVQVGKWAFRSGYPGRIDMWPYRGSEKDCGYEFAPTSARDVGEIDASDKRLRWFRFDKNRRVTLPVPDLPK